MLKSALSRGLLASTLFMTAAMGVAHASDGAKKWEAINQTKVSLVQAIDAAEKHQAGAKAVEADFDAKGDKSYYEVKVVTSDKEVYEVKVDAKTGEVISSEKDD